jgi:hypothetical protein
MTLMTSWRRLKKPVILCDLVVASVMTLALYGLEGVLSNPLIATHPVPYLSWIFLILYAVPFLVLAIDAGHRWVSSE